MTSVLATYINHISRDGQKEQARRMVKIGHPARKIPKDDS